MQARELERGNQRLEVRLTSLTFDVGGDTARKGSKTAAFCCDGSVFEIARSLDEDAEAFARRAEAEGIALARANIPKLSSCPRSGEPVRMIYESCELTALEHLERLYCNAN